jgi:protein O-mannosyl-transferase
MPTRTLNDTTEPTSFNDVAARLRARAAGLPCPERAIPLAIVLAVIAVFAVALRNDFVRWDDYRNLVDNPHFRGLGWTQLTWMFTTTLMGHYIPLTWLTFGLDYVVWGLQPAGFHFTNLVLHAANAALFYWVAKRVLRAARPAASETALRAGAAVAALFFAVHPLRAESVAWVTERRDVLSGLLFLTSVLAYLRAAASVDARRRWLLGVSLAAFALAMLAKSIVMTLPLLLVVLDWYPLRRLTLSSSRDNRRVLLEKLPFLAIGVAGAALSYWAVSHQGFITASTKYPLPSRVAMALYSVVFYLSKTVVPVDLSPMYELPARVDPLAPQFLGAAIAVALVTVTLAALAGRWPGGLAAYAWYAIMLAPVGGLVHSGFQLAHDRYSYLSCLPFAVLIGGGVAWLVGAYAARTVRPPLFGASCVAIAALIAAFGALAWLQAQVWRDTEALWLHATYATPECSMCHNNYGAVLVNRPTVVPPDELAAAAEHFHQALMLRPDIEKTYGGLGLLYLRLGRYREAEVALRRAIANAPVEVGPYNNLGFALNQQGRFAEAVPYLRKGLDADEHNVIARANLGQALVAVGRFDEAIAELRRATDEQPFAPEPRIAIILAYHKARKTAEMRKHLTILRQLHPVTARDLAATHRL